MPTYRIHTHDGSRWDRTEYLTEAEAVEALRQWAGWEAVALDQEMLHMVLPDGGEVYRRCAYATEAERDAADPDDDFYVPSLHRVVEVAS